MIVETRIAHPQEMFVVWLPLQRIFRQGMFSIFQRQDVLNDVDQRLLTRQSAFTIEQEILEAGITRSRKRSCLANGREGAVHVVWLKLLPCHPAQDLCWRMTTIFPFFVCEVVVFDSCNPRPTFCAPPRGLPNSWPFQNTSLPSVFVHTTPFLSDFASFAASQSLSS